MIDSNTLRELYISYLKTFNDIGKLTELELNDLEVMYKNTL